MPSASADCCRSIPVNDVTRMMISTAAEGEHGAYFARAVFRLRRVLVGPFFRNELIRTSILKSHDTPLCAKRFDA